MLNSISRGKTGFFQGIIHLIIHRIKNLFLSETKERKKKCSHLQESRASYIWEMEPGALN